VSVRKEALERLAQAAVKKVDDWGWTGGKPGEITGGEYIKAYKKATNAAEDAVEAAGFKRYSTQPEPDEIYWSVIDKEVGTMPDDFAKQLSDGAEKLKIHRGFLKYASLDSLVPVASDFAKLERAGVPRKWTGKVFPALKAYERNTGIGGTDLAEDLPQKLSNFMRPLTNDQRAEFLALLPEWYGSLDDLAAAARNL
jgi:hypothetical protein